MSLTASVEPRSSTALPGGDLVAHTLRLRNEGDTVEEYGLSVVGPLARWAVVEPTQLRLFPGDEGTAVVSFDVPRVKDASAGATPFGVRVQPRMHPELTDVVEGTVVVEAFAELRAELAPITVRGRWSTPLRLSIENRGNTPLAVRLRGRDQEDTLSFTGPATPVEIPAGETGRPALVVRRRRWRLVGQPERYPLTVDVMPDEVAETAGARPVQLRGTFVHLALLRRWVLTALVAAVVIALGAATVGYFSGFLPGLVAPLIDRSRVVAASPVPQDQPAQTQPAQTQQPQGQQTSGSQPPAQAPPAGQQTGQQPPTPEQRPQSDEPAVALGVPVVITREGLMLDTRTGADDVPFPVSEPLAPARATWVLRPLQDGAVLIVPTAAPDRSLDQSAAQLPDARGDVALRLAPVPQQQSPGPSQSWTLRDAGPGAVVIVNRSSGDCLTEVGINFRLVVSPCRSIADAQVWTVRRV